MQRLYPNVYSPNSSQTRSTCFLLSCQKTLNGQGCICLVVHPPPQHIVPTKESSAAACGWKNSHIIFISHLAESFPLKHTSMSWVQPSKKRRTTKTSTCLVILSLHIITIQIQHFAANKLHPQRCSTVKWFPTLDTLSQISLHAGYWAMQETDAAGRHSNPSLRLFQETVQMLVGKPG